MQNQENLTIRFADPGDAEALLEIYRPYVEKTAVSFETAVPSVEEFRGRIRRILEHYPYLAAEKDGALLGYAYAGPFVGRAAYRWSAEVTIYLREDQKKKGIGRMLYARLEELLKARHITNLYACIGFPRKRRTNTLPETVWNFTPTWGTAWQENFTNADTNSADGTAWSGWKRFCPATRSIRRRESLVFSERRWYTEEKRRRIF